MIDFSEKITFYIWHLKINLLVILILVSVLDGCSSKDVKDVVALPLLAVDAAISVGTLGMVTPNLQMKALNAMGRFGKPGGGNAVDFGAPSPAFVSMAGYAAKGVAIGQANNEYAKLNKQEQQYHDQRYYNIESQQITNKLNQNLVVADNLINKNDGNSRANNINKIYESSSKTIGQEVEFNAVECLYNQTDSFGSNTVNGCEFLIRVYAWNQTRFKFLTHMVRDGGFSNIQSELQKKGYTSATSWIICPDKSRVSPEGSCVWSRISQID